MTGQTPPFRPCVHPPGCLCCNWCGFRAGQWPPAPLPPSAAPADRAVDFNSSHEVAIDRAYKWDPDMSQCPRGVKVQLLGAGGVPAYALYDGKDPFWIKWAPLPSN